MRYLISFFLFSIYLHGFNYHLKPYKISEGIHCFFGLPSQVSYINGGNIVNSCYIETEKSYVVIDSGPTYAYAQEAYEIMKKKKQLPVKYVINTSWDEVHILGNEFYKELGAELIGPKGYKDYMENKKTLFLEKKVTKDAFFNTRVIPLDKYLTKDTPLNFKNMTMEIKMVEDDYNHLYVHIKEKDIVFAGDLVFNNRMVPLNNGRSLIKWLQGLEELSSLKWSNIISSHGYMTRRSALKNTKEYLSLLRTEVLTLLKEGKSREEILKKVKLISFAKDKFYALWQKKNVEIAYEELKSTIKTVPKVSEENNLSIKIIKKIEIKAVDNKKDKNNTKEEKEIVVESKPKLQLEYKSFSQALSGAVKKHKIVLIKVRSTACRYCDELDRIIEDNTEVQNILNKYFELVKINVDDESLPLEIMVRSTPTLVFIRADNQEILMQLNGIKALGELIEVLNEAVNDGHEGNYLKQ